MDAQTPKTREQRKKEVSQLLAGIQPYVTEEMITRSSLKTGFSTWTIKRYLKGDVGYPERAYLIYNALKKEIDKQS